MLSEIILSNVVLGLIFAIVMGGVVLILSRPPREKEPEGWIPTAGCTCYKCVGARMEQDDSTST